jgi:hypothetical protein
MTLFLAECLRWTGPELVTLTSGDGRLTVGGCGAGMGAGGASLLEVVELVVGGGEADLQESSAKARAEARIRRTGRLGHRFMETLR